MPLSYWPLAFKIAVYSINRLPTPILAFLSPLEKLFHWPPNYLKLRTFGCLSFPWTKPYNNHKLQSKSVPCIFINWLLWFPKCLPVSSSRNKSHLHLQTCNLYLRYLSLQHFSPSFRSSSFADAMSQHWSTYCSSTSSSSRFRYNSFQCSLFSTACILWSQSVTRGLFLFIYPPCLIFTGVSQCASNKNTPNDYTIHE